MINKFTIEDVRHFWDRVASIYEPTNKNVGYAHTQRFEKALEFSQCKPGMRILNIWSRTGNLLPYLRTISNLEIHNREVSPAMMKISIDKFPEEEFKLTDLENLSEFPDNYFDRIISLETLEHTPKPLVFLKELHRIVKPDGLLIMSLPPKGFDIPTWLYEQFFPNHGEGPHNFPWPYQVKRVLKKSEFTILKHKKFIIVPLINDKLTRASEAVLGFLFGWTPLANFGIRQFYIAKK